MNSTIIIAVAATGLVLGGLLGYVISRSRVSKRILAADAKSKDLLFRAKAEALNLKEEAEKDKEKKQAELKEYETSLRRKEEVLDRRSETIEKERSEIKGAEKEAAELREKIKKVLLEQQKELQQISHLKKEDAKELLLQSVEKEFKDEVIKKIKESKEETRELAEVETRKILSTVINRLASEHAAEHTTMAVHLPNEEMKGRIIGKEGRNIQIFEKTTGVDLVIDDTPDMVIISSFNPVRRHIAKRALDELIVDGRINPARIEETVSKAQAEVKKEMKEAGEEAVRELGVTGFHPDLVKIIGSLHFRTSYGQNVLRHSMEVGHIAGMLAQEIGADANICKKAAILHDTGKAVSHEISKAHHHISGDIARKYGMSEAVIHAAMAHHDDIEPKTVEALVVRAADAISGARPGARRETAEQYIQRLTELENIANSFEGVDKTYAIQAGREIRIIVKPEEIDDLKALKLAQNIARKIEAELKYPGIIKVSVIRETRATEYAK